MLAGQELLTPASTAYLRRTSVITFCNLECAGWLLRIEHGIMELSLCLISSMNSGRVVIPSHLASVDPARDVQARPEPGASMQSISRGPWKDGEARRGLEVRSSHRMKCLVLNCDRKMTTAPSATFLLIVSLIPPKERLHLGHPRIFTRNKLSQPRQLVLVFNTPWGKALLSSLCRTTTPRSWTTSLYPFALNATFSQELPQGAMWSNHERPQNVPREFFRVCPAK
jgi:hypothetical protein